MPLIKATSNFRQDHFLKMFFFFQQTAAELKIHQVWHLITKTDRQMHTYTHTHTQNFTPDIAKLPLHSSFLPGNAFLH